VCAEGGMRFKSFEAFFLKKPYLQILIIKDESEYKQISTQEWRKKDSVFIKGLIGLIEFTRSSFNSIN